MTNKEQTISNLKKLKSFHNGSYGVDINRAIKALEKETILDKIIAEIERHRRKTKYIDPYDLVGDCLEIVDKYKEAKMEGAEE